MEIFCNIVNVFITFDQFKASLKRINLYTAPPPPKKSLSLSLSLSIYIYILEVGID